MGNVENTLYSDKTWVFDQSVGAQGPIYIINKIQAQYVMAYSILTTNTNNIVIQVHA